MIIFFAVACTMSRETGKVLDGTDTDSENDSADSVSVPDDTAAADADGDGSPDDVDCAPDDPSIGTTTHERYGNEVDDDCDGTVDEALTEDDADSAMTRHPVMMLHGSAMEDSLLVGYVEDVWDNVTVYMGVNLTPAAEAPGANTEDDPDVLLGFDDDVTAFIGNAGDLDGDGVDDISIGNVHTFSDYHPSDPAWTGAIPGSLDGMPYVPDAIGWRCDDPAGGWLQKVGDGVATPFVTACYQYDGPRYVSLYGREAFADGTAIESEAISWITLSDESVGDVVRPGADIDGDGLVDLGIGCNADNVDDASALRYFLSGSIAPGDNVESDVTLVTSPTMSSSWAFADVDADGYQDLVFGDLDLLSDIVTWRVFLAFASKSSWTQADASSSIEPTVAGLTFPYGEARNMGDRDGDERDDVLVTVNLPRDYSESDDGYHDTVSILPGSALGTPGTWMFSDAIFRIEGRPDDVLLSPFVDADVDGTGYTDLILKSYETRYLEEAGEDRIGVSLIYSDPGVL
jgi:hypothetical protein